MTSLLDGPRAGLLRGSVQPRIFAEPPRLATSGDELADFAAHHGLVLDEWQRLALRVAMGERPDGNWSAFEVGIVVGRQNGKGSIIEARELGGLFLLGERMIMHTAHQFKTSAEAFLRILNIIEGSDDLRKRVKRIARSPVDQGIELTNGNRLRFVARSGGSGRGFSADLVILDEAYNLPQETMDALVPTLSTIPNPQVWYLSSAGMADSDVLAAVRTRAQSDNPGSLAYLEWSAPETADPDDPAAWAQANPALGIRITEEFILREREALSDAGFARERLGIWDDPTLAGRVIDPASWANCLEPESALTGPPSFAVDISPDRSWATIAVSGVNGDRLHVEVTSRDGVIDHRPGTEWLLPRIGELKQAFPAMSLTVASSSAAESLRINLEASGIGVNLVSAHDVQAACGLFYDHVLTGKLAHLGQSSLDAALGSAKKRVEDGENAWVWGRKRSAGDITPLYAATLALYSAVEALNMSRHPAMNVW